MFIVRLFPKDALRLILLDDKGFKIYCWVNSDFASRYAELLKENLWFSITQFRVLANTDSVRLTNCAFMISIFGMTVVLDADPPAVEPCNDFTLFCSIVDGTVNETVLVDVIGVLFDVGILVNIGTNPMDLDGLGLTFRRAVLEFHKNYDSCAGRPLVCVLRLWKVERYFDGPKNVRIVNRGLISKVLPCPYVPEAADFHSILAIFVVGRIL
ncbi:unnamed protein product [Arabidopsis arenosa]|uniref:Replication protein A 70 kDa DNA-binding subunit B/D first OB fold domain-containing protein n=1 Tax=Arabidopsis arenosa TaxID=38785 RepID=A0A8S1ZTB0_ARAAE|nr:unnamed protein product [Arabidopsis arenosa]